MNEEYVVYKHLNREEEGEKYLFLKEFLIDPAKPNDIYSNIVNPKLEK